MEVNGDLMIINGDLVVNRVNSNLRVVTSDDCIIQTAIHNMINNEVNAIYGRRLKLTQSDMKIVESDCKNAILVDNRVKDVSRVIANNVGNYTCKIYFELVTVDGRTLNNVTQINLQ